MKRYSTDEEHYLIWELNTEESRGLEPTYKLISHVKKTQNDMQSEKVTCLKKFRLTMNKVHNVLNEKSTCNIKESEDCARYHVKYTFEKLLVQHTPAWEVNAVGNHVLKAGHAQCLVVWGKTKLMKIFTARGYMLHKKSDMLILPVKTGNHVD